MGWFDRSHRRWVALVVLILAATAIAGTATGGTALVVERADNGETVLRTPVTNGTEVGLEYTHSVEKTRVYDEYTVRNGTLVMTRMEFESYGWGLPADANVTRENGTFVYDPPGAYDQIRVSPGPVANHSLSVGDRTYDLVERADGKSVIIRVVRYSPLTRIREL